MNSGFSFQETLNILKTDASEEIFHEIETKLSEGETADVFITDYCGKRISGYLNGFLACMNLRDALSAALIISKEESEERTVLIKGCLYPCVLLGAMCAGIFLFATYILPTMLGLMNSLNADSEFDYERLSVIIRGLSVFLLVFLLIAAAVCRAAFSRKHIASTYLLLAKRFPESIPVKSATRDFTRFFLECSRRHMSTYETLHMLKKIDEKPLTALIASLLDDSLLRGDSLEEAMNRCPVEKALVRFIHIAASAADCTGMLEGYLIMCRKRTEASIRRFSRTVQLVSYTLIGFVLIFVYSILMMPMSMLSQI